MASEPNQMSCVRLQANMQMLESSLKRVFPAQDDRQFADLLRRLDMPSQPTR